MKELFQSPELQNIGWDGTTKDGEFAAAGKVPNKSPSAGCSVSVFLY
jgi:hypothetical protein